MGSLKMEGMSLPTLFDQARKIHLLASDSAVDKETLRKGCESLLHCEEMISKLGLFSTNETKEEITTTNLKYILVPYYLAELTEKTGHDNRIEILKVSQAKLKEFLSFCDAMELVPEDELEASAQGGQSAVIDRRAKKIARFKRQRAAESKLLELKERKERRGRSTKASALSTPVDNGDDDTIDDDGEEEREAWLTTISLAICKALDLMEMLKKEEEMLSAIKEKQEQEGNVEISQAILEERAKTVEDWHRNAAARARYTKPAVPITCATFAQDVLEGRAKISQTHDHKHQPLMFGPASLVGGSITSERERIAAQVFQPSHRFGETVLMITPVSIWRPRQSPVLQSPDLAYCIDESIAEETTFEEQHIWSAPESYPWTCCIYQVHSPALHFVALRQPKDEATVKPMRVIDDSSRQPVSLSSEASSSTSVH